AFPLAERALSPLVRALMGQAKTPQEVSVLGRALERDQISPQQFPQLVEALGPAGMPIDIGENTMRMGAGIASLPGEGQTVIRNATANRQYGNEALGVPSANARIQAGVNDALGPAPI